uniref:t-SNARE coiled-coil homology domain-containing protein n=1 Tax=Ananas comosus var. bracteatus TaxID=296719 RepID=A0A6V7NTE0_ANACO|nr:unnamed protein product [Ananas comosus var. bracteatus]
MSGGDELMLLKKAVAEGGGGDGDLVVAVQEMEDRQEVASGLERSLLELQQLFLDMAVLVEAQAQHLDDIEQQVAAAADFVETVPGPRGCSAVPKERSPQGGVDRTCNFASAAAYLGRCRCSRCH